MQRYDRYLCQLFTLNTNQMKVRTLLLALIFIIGSQSFAQIAPNKYFVQFTDKNDSPFSIDHPEEFLTQRAIDRRDAQGIDIVANDIPVNPQYLEGVAAKGAQLFFATRWLNGVTIFTTSQTVLDDVMSLPYVENVRSLGNDDFPVEKPFFESESYGDEYGQANYKKGDIRSDLDYGDAEFQIQQIYGISLHNDGFMGEGMVIAVLDGGFSGVLEHPAFDSLWENNQILGTKDFIYVGGDVYTESAHGKAVLSCMGANVPGKMIGTAPKASYWLIRSEDVKSETLIEEYNWVSAAEFADSVGADVINSSLSYSGFDDPVWDHSYEDLDGNTAIATIGADIAASKGILVHNSAGNSGNSGFPWNGAPADADSVISCGAVGWDDQYAGFSSIGPTADGRIRPIVMALGAGAFVASGTNDYTYANGTSFSSPILAGMSTCLWQANPNLKVMEVYEGIKESASEASNPNNQMGWGIANYAKANSVLTTVEYQTDKAENKISLWPNPFVNDLNIQLLVKNSGIVQLELLNASGAIIVSRTVDLSSNQKISFENLSEIPKGVYFLRVTGEDWVEVERLIKQ